MVSAALAAALATAGSAGTLLAEKPDRSEGGRNSRLWSSNIPVPVNRDKLELLNMDGYLDILQKGIDQLLMGQFKDAIGTFEKAAKIDPNQAEIYYNMGIAWFQLGKVSNAIVNYRKAIDLRTGFAEARNNLGVCYIKEKLLDIGADQLRLANIYAPALREPLENLEALRNKDTEFNYNDKLFRTRHDLRESAPSRIFSLSLKMCAPVLNVSEEIIAKNEAALAEKRTMERLKMLKTEELTEKEREILQKYPDVFTSLRSEVTIDNDFSKYWDALNLLKVAEEQFDKKLYRESIGNFTRVLNFAPNAMAVYYRRGVARVYAKNYQGAEGDFKFVIKHSDDNDLVRQATEQVNALRERTFSNF